MAARFICSAGRRGVRQLRHFSVASSNSPPTTPSSSPPSLLPLPRTPTRPHSSDTAEFERKVRPDDAACSERQASRPEVDRDTIYALASASGRSGVAVVRLSGQQAGELIRRRACTLRSKDQALLALQGGSKRSLPAARLAALRRLHHPHSGSLLDHALVVRFPAPASFTGEDVVELHLHGSPAVVRALLGAMAELPGLRMARAGEFARRAFLAGKMDLCQLESTADLLAAETEAQREQAVAMMDGGPSSIYNRWRKELLGCLSSVEAVLDFGEDADLSDSIAVDVRRRASALRQGIQQQLNDGRRGELVRDGVRAVLLGPPNAGKVVLSSGMRNRSLPPQSSILNLLAGRPAAIVASQPGTTRDIVEVPLDLGGLKVIMSDTAGIREGGCEVEEEGIRRAVEAARMADVLLVVLDASAVLGVRSDLHNDGGSYLAALTHRLSSEGLLNGHSLPLIVVLNKMDLLSAEKVDSSQSAFSQDTADHSSESGAAVQQLLGKSTAFGNSSSAIVMQLSCKTGKGADAVVRRLQSLAESLCGSRSGAETAPLITRHRHRELLKACVSALLRYEDSWDELELAAEELRSAARDLGSITGAIETEEVLEAIFSEFCIGK